MLYYIFYSLFYSIFYSLFIILHIFCSSAGEGESLMDSSSERTAGDAAAWAMAARRDRAVAAWRDLERRGSASGGGDKDTRREPRRSLGVALDLVKYATTMANGTGGSTHSGGERQWRQVRETEENKSEARGDGAARKDLGLLREDRERWRREGRTSWEGEGRACCCHCSREQRGNGRGSRETSPGERSRCGVREPIPRGG